MVEDEPILPWFGSRRDHEPVEVSEMESELLNHFPVGKCAGRKNRGQTFAYICGFLRIAACPIEDSTT